MFKVTKTDFSSPFLPGSVPLDEVDTEALSHYAVTERWSGDLENGIFNLGEKTALAHGFKQRTCGLLNLVRCYDPMDRTRLLEIFEQASATASSFCFSTTIHLDGAPRQPIFCIGESTGFEDKSGSIIGVFIFPRFQLDAACPTFKRQ